MYGHMLCVVLMYSLNILQAALALSQIVLLTSIMKRVHGLMLLTSIMNRLHQMLDFYTIVANHNVCFSSTQGNWLITVLVMTAKDVGLS